MIIIGLTGSIAMGKSETARMFQRLGYPVFDADTVVHQLYRRGGSAVESVGEAFPAALDGDVIDRQRLAAEVVGNPEAMKKLEAIVHPLVRKRQMAFLRKAKRAGYRLAVLDIPLLFESGRKDEVDKIVVVSAPQSLQRARAFERPGMTDDKFKAIVKHQLSDAEKRRQADFVIDTSRGLEDAYEQVRTAVDQMLSVSKGEAKNNA
jgi:dephospho-CoA kinase